MPGVYISRCQCSLVLGQDAASSYLLSSSPLLRYTGLTASADCWTGMLGRAVSDAFKMEGVRADALNLLCCQYQMDPACLHFFSRAELLAAGGWRTWRTSRSRRGAQWQTCARWWV